ncbi:MAG: hypothetical protein CMK74_22005 [Pseudomonadales bacterium]|nr:hypothetical protein [Pseudomonadales bacterium]|tara:strand:+ start:1561 stop:2052 length:492 start_codon:yes stop_codon:yes gene_type:complete
MGWPVLITCDEFYTELDSFQVLPQQIHTVDVDAFKKAYGQESAGRDRDIVYALRTETPMPRLKGVSDVVYIGMTGGSFRQRYLPHAKLHATSVANRVKYQHILESYGSIRITVAPYRRYGPDLRTAEGQLLWWYFRHHCEYPPVNYTQTQVRTDSIPMLVGEP